MVEDNGVAIPLEYFNPPSTQRMSLPRKPDLKIQEVVVVAAKQNQVSWPPHSFWGASVQQTKLVF